MQSAMQSLSRIEDKSKLRYAHEDTEAELVGLIIAVKNRFLMCIAFIWFLLVCESDSRETWFSWLGFAFVALALVARIL